MRGKCLGDRGLGGMCVISKCGTFWYFWVFLGWSRMPISDCGLRIVSDGWGGGSSYLWGQVWRGWGFVWAARGGEGGGLRIGDLGGRGGGGFCLLLRRGLGVVGGMRMALGVISGRRGGAGEVGGGWEVRGIGVVVPSGHSAVQTHHAKTPDPILAFANSLQAGDVLRFFFSPQLSLKPLSSSRRLRHEIRREQRCIV